VAFDADLVLYDGSYENSQLFSPKFRAFAEDLSDSLRDRFSLEGGHVVEVGCGKGEFLAMLCNRGAMRGTGYDPTYEGEAEALSPDGSLRVLRRPYDEHAQAEPADLVACRHVLEHIDDPVRFLRTIRTPMQPGTVLYLEVPNARFTFTESGLWDLIYQHCIYFTAEALDAAARAAGFEVMRTEAAFDGQFVALEAMAGSLPDVDRPIGAVDGASETIEGFARPAARFEHLISEWRERLERWHTAGRRVALWGAGAKGVTFLTLVDAGARVDTIVDINRRKQGRHLAGTGHRVDAPEALCRVQPDVVMITNAAYRSEIAESLDTLGVASEIVSL
jgi:SAM-dependent methyltransferase